MSTKKSSKKAKKGAKRYGVSAEQFVKAWSSSNSVDEVMKKLGMPKNAVYSRVNSYRAKKIELKSMRRPHKVLDVDALNKIAREATKER